MEPQDRICVVARLDSELAEGYCLLCVGRGRKRVSGRSEFPGGAGVGETTRGPYRVSAGERGCCAKWATLFGPGGGGSSLLGLPAQKSWDVQIVGGNVLAYFSEVLLDLVDDVRQCVLHRRVADCATAPLCTRREGDVVGTV